MGTSSELLPMLAANPSTPVRILAELALHFPAIVLHNPMLLLGQLAGKDVLASFSREALGLMCKQEDAPEAFQRWSPIVGHPLRWSL